MNKNILLFGLLAVGGVGTYLILKRNHSQAPGADTYNQHTSGLLDFLSSGSGYPFKMSAKPRVDNQAQPYANGSRVFIGPNDSNSMVKAAQDIGAASSIVQSLSDIWGNIGVGDWFGSGDSSTLNSGDDSNDFDWGFDFDSIDAGDANGIDWDSDAVDSGEYGYDTEVA